MSNFGQTPPTFSFGDVSWDNLQNVEDASGLPIPPVSGPPSGPPSEPPIPPFTTDEYCCRYLFVHGAFWCAEKEAESPGVRTDAAPSPPEAAICIELIWHIKCECQVQSSPEGGNHTQMLIGQSCSDKNNSDGKNTFAYTEWKNLGKCDPVIYSKGRKCERDERGKLKYAMSLPAFPGAEGTGHGQGTDPFADPELRAALRHCDITVSGQEVPDQPAAGGASINPGPAADGGTHEENIYEELDQDQADCLNELLCCPKTPEGKAFQAQMAKAVLIPEIKDGLGWDLYCKKAGFPPVDPYGWGGGYLDPNSPCKC
jgi:hypothetical protein